MAKTVSDKNTKTEILEAYNEVLAKLKEVRAQGPQSTKKESEVKGVVQAASTHSIEGIVKNLADLKVEFVKTVDSLEEKMIAEFKKLSGLQQAIDIQSKTLKEVYEIETETESLAALIMAQREKRETFEIETKEKKDTFDADMTEKRLQWKKEQEEYEAGKRERDALMKKERQREEEEYTYSLNLSRKKESDDYETRKALLEKELTDKKAAFEKEWSERESAIIAKEKELTELREKVALFPKDLEKVVKETERAVTDKIDFRYRHEMELIQKEIEGEKKLNQQTIAALESKIKEQDELIRQLTQKANESVQQVQAIAVKAIEGASAQRVFTERTKEG